MTKIINSIVLITMVLLIGACSDEIKTKSKTVEATREPVETKIKVRKTLEEYIESEGVKRDRLSKESLNRHLKAIDKIMSKTTPTKTRTRKRRSYH